MVSPGWPTYPLHYAIRRGRVQIVEYLLSKGANPLLASHAGTAGQTNDKFNHDPIKSQINAFLNIYSLGNSHGALSVDIAGRQGKLELVEPNLYAEASPFLSHSNLSNQFLQFKLTLQVEFGSLGKGPLHFSNPWGICQDHTTGRLFIADHLNGRIQVYQADGSHEKVIGSPGNQKDQLHLPNALAVHPLNHLLYISDGGNDRIQVFTVDGTHRHSFGSPGSAEGQFNIPSGLAIDSAGDIFVSERENNRIQVFSPEGVPKLSFGKPGSLLGCLNVPTGLAIDPESGNLYVAEKGNKRIQMFTTTGKELKIFGEGILEYPIEIALDPISRTLFVSDHLKHSIARFTFGGKFIEIVGGFSTPLGLSYHPTSHHLFVVEDTKHRVQKYSVNFPSIEHLDGLNQNNSPGPPNNPQAGASNLHIHQSLSIPFEHLTIDSKSIASGAAGTVHKSTYTVAVKKLFAGDAELQRELAKWLHFRHPNLVLLIGFSQSEDQKPLIIMELMDRSLFHHLQDQSIALPWSTRLGMALGIASGLRYLHEVHRVIHRDIKSLNILVRGNDVKIADFGTSRGLTSLASSLAGTHRWVAPELYNGDSPSFAGDIYALGVVLNELLTRKVPFIELSNNDPAIMKAVTTGKRPEMAPFPADLSLLFVTPFVQLIEKCWDQDPLLRPSAAAVFASLETMIRSISSTSDNHYFDSSKFVFGEPHSQGTPLWTMQTWLRLDVGLEQYIPLFEAQKLSDRGDIQALTDQDLKDIGIQAMGDRKRVLRFIAQLYGK